MAGMVAHIKSANPVDSVVPVGGVDVGTVTNISAGVSKVIFAFNTGFRPIKQK